MTANSRITIALVVLFVALLAAVLWSGRSTNGGGGPVRTGAVDDSRDAVLVRPDSHRLSTATEGDVTFVEFLDFECEGCRAAYPAVEQLREEYAGRATFVIRYFPMPGHFNAERAAIAVEAAAQQGALEPMYRRMFETQPEWGERQVPMDQLFRTFAEDLGLDMAAYDEAVADPATLERVRRDREDGLALGVQGTPTFFLNSEKLQPESYADLKSRLDAAVAP